MKDVLEHTGFIVALALRRAVRRIFRIDAQKERDAADAEIAELSRRIGATVRASHGLRRRFLVKNRLWDELSEEVVFDPQRLERLQEETERVSLLLETVFAHDGELDPEPYGDPSRRFPGLERRHAAFLADLAVHDALRMDAFAALARRHALLPHGAMEAINEWAFDKIGESVLNDGDPIEIAGHLLRPRETRPQHMRKV